jgi:Fe2+ transport system protein FeoA
VTTLDSTALGTAVVIRKVGGSETFRRRLLELGLVPGTLVRVIAVAPLGDPLQLEVRGGQWSIRRREAAEIAVEPAP